ncbi:outer membrane protein [Alteriqipengyuania lutimaris]|uniref:Porin family protein n=1 Tax=Alteriqipengyuania lutimaris TaxID=1538146 RepID=A0A395LIL9_9SPHN|nr:outer membrane beta-barrel protein [Alteriqipengyuania lutimaris]MBB3035244.1 outer membrane immunogenic protein [Alteriqipengyuania lutimaris]RDS76127.1 porin family protein [Alteriqipengyuania lutimaris]
MKTAFAILATASMAALATPAAAQVDTDSPFSGFRVQATGGYDQLRAGSSIDDDVNEDNNDQSAEGFLYGGAIGYDVDLGSVVIGPEAELTGSTADTDFENGDFEGFGFGNVSAGRDLYLGARVGVKANENMMFYAKGGYTNAKLDLRTNDGTTELETDYDLDGYRVGGGLEYAFGNNLFTNIEYRYSNYSRAEGDFADDVADSERFDVDTDRHQVTVGVGARF